MKKSNRKKRLHDLFFGIVLSVRFSRLYVCIVSFKTVSAILRGRWLLDKTWVAAQMPLIVSVLQGKASFAEFQDEDEIPGDEAEKKKAVLVLSNKYGSVYKVGYYTDLSSLPDGSIAMLTLAGPVSKYGGLCSYGSVDHVQTMNRLSAANNVKGIILNIDSPGGEAAGTAMLANAIKAATNNKPVVAMIDDGIAASAAMWIASAANEIYTTQKTDQVGSIGVYTTVADWYGYFEKEGLRVRDIYAPQSTDKNGDYRAAIETPPNDEPIKEDLKILAQEFIDTVKANRAGKIKGEDWATGKMYYSKDAKRLGLIDGTKSMDQIMKRMNTLINDKQNSTNMAFEKTMVAAKTEQFEVVDGGFLLQEAELNNIEVTLIENETKISGLQTALNERERELQTSNDMLTVASETITEKDNEITALKNEIAGLKKGPAADFQGTKKDKDDLGGGAAVEESDATKENKRNRALLGLPNNF